MTDSKTKVQANRRGFLKFAGLGSVAGGAALVAGKSPQAAEVKADGRGASYRETEHVKAFYKSARF